MKDYYNTFREYNIMYTSKEINKPTFKTLLKELNVELTKAFEENSNKFYALNFELEEMKELNKEYHTLMVVYDKIVAKLEELDDEEQKILH